MSFLLIHVGTKLSKFKIKVCCAFSNSLGIIFQAPIVSPSILEKSVEKIILFLSNATNNHQQCPFVLVIQSSSVIRVGDEKGLKIRSKIHHGVREGL